jgi:hypothetical protein
MKLNFSAGPFDIETWTEGYPMWMKLSYKGQEIESTFHHSELKDLAHVIERMRVQARANMNDRYKHELD